MAKKTKKLEAELFQVRAQLERTSSAKLYEMLNLYKSASDRTSLRYDISSSNIASTSTIVFVPLSNNVEIENNVVKNELASENMDYGKSILGASLSRTRKKLKTLGLRKLTLKSLNRRSTISVITMEQPIILYPIAING